MAWDMVAAAIGGGVLKGAFDWLKARGQQDVDARTQLDAAYSEHFKRLEADITELRKELAIERAARIAAEQRLAEREAEWYSVVESTRALMAQRQKQFDKIMHEMQAALAQTERNAAERIGVTNHNE